MNISLALDHVDFIKNNDRIAQAEFFTGVGGGGGGEKEEMGGLLDSLSPVLLIQVQLISKLFRFLWLWEGK